MRVHLSGVGPKGLGLVLSNLLLQHLTISIIISHLREKLVVLLELLVHSQSDLLLFMQDDRGLSVELTCTLLRVWVGVKEAVVAPNVVHEYWCVICHGLLLAHRVEAVDHSPLSHDN